MTLPSRFLASLLLIIMVILTGVPAQAFLFNRETSCSLNSAPIDMVDSFAKEILKPLHLEMIERDASGYCNDELAQRFLFSESPEMGELFKATYAEYQRAFNEGTTEALLEKLSDIEPNPTAWSISLIPAESVREKLLNDIPTGNIGNNVNLEGAIQMLKQERCSLPDPYIFSGFNIEEKKPRSDKSFGIQNQSMAKRYACFETLGITSTFSCDQAASTIDRIARPAVTGVTGAEVYRNVLNDSRYDEGLRRAALKIAARANDGTETKGDLFSDLKSSFLESGESSDAAEEMAWNSVALLATGGPNVFLRLPYFKGDRDSSQKRLALNTISHLIPVLDHRSSAKGKVYSLPKEVKGACNTGKTYHFWFTAYLARRAALESKNPEASAAMAFQAEKAYQLTSRSPDSARQSATSPLFSPASTIIRGDLVYASAGAVYGANRAGNRTPSGLNIDKEIAGMIKTAGVGNPGVIFNLASQTVNSDLATTYGKWTEKFNANATFENTRKAGFPNKVHTGYLEFEKSPKKSPCAANP